MRRSPCAVTQAPSIPASPGVSGTRSMSSAEARKAVDDHFAFLGLERTRAVDEQPTRLNQARRLSDQTALERDAFGGVVLALQAQDVRVTADGAGGAARRVKKDGVELAARVPGGGVGLDDVGFQVETRQILGQPAQADR